MKVKVCGITSYEDAVLALDAGCDGLGFNFYAASPRYIEPAAARAIVRRLPPFATTVGLFVNDADPRAVAARAAAAGVAVLQLHGDESPEFCRKLARWPVIKAIRVGEGFSAAGLEAYPVSAFLLDAKDSNLYGGTGRTFDWRLAVDVKQVRPVILAGGLRPGNVAAAIRAVRPYGVDVSSGVEERPGKKDPKKLAAFIEEVRHACEDI